MSIIINKQGENATVLQKTGFQKEDYLQEYILNYPESIPVYELKSDKKLFVAKREFPTNSGPIDALAFDKDGDIYIIETKLFKNPDKRTVVAQALDYGAALWKHFTDFNRLIELLNQETQKNFNLSFQEITEKFFKIDHEQYDSMLGAIRTNLNDGNIKFVVLMDSIDERLKDLIIYINQNSQFDIYAVQLEYYRFKEYEITIPKLFGIGAKKKVTGSVKTRLWDEESFMKELKSVCGQTEATISKKIIDWGKPFGMHPKWTKAVNAFFHLVLKFKDNEYKILSISSENGGTIWNRFGDYAGYPPFDDEEKRRELLNRLNSIDGISITNNPSVTKNSGIIISILNDDAVYNEFVSTYEWVVKEIKDNS